MPGPSETLPVLEQRLVARLLDFDRLDTAWPRGRTAIERAGIGRQLEDALSLVRRDAPRNSSAERSLREIATAMKPSVVDSFPCPLQAG